MRAVLRARRWLYGTKSAGFSDVSLKVQPPRSSIRHPRVALRQGMIRFIEIRADSEDSAVDAGFRFAMKERPIANRLEYELLVDTLDHFAGLLAGRVEAELHQDLIH
jgi:hypothetical protein